MTVDRWHAWATVRDQEGASTAALVVKDAVYSAPRLWSRAVSAAPAVRSIWDVVHADGATRDTVVQWCLDHPDEAARAAIELGNGRDYTLPLSPMRRHVLCVGLNYDAHVKEGAPVVGRSAEGPEAPIYFTKPPASVVGPSDAIDAHIGRTQRLDYEAELAVVIGRGGRDIDPGSALDHVFGYAIFNDVSARDLQAARKQWYKGKSLDGTSPFGPWIVPSSVITDPQNLLIRLTVNGEVRQEASTRDMLHGVARIIADLSDGHTLEAGDVIATGTPSGCGFAMQPPRFLQPGDIIEAAITGLGVQRNVVR